MKFKLLYIEINEVDERDEMLRSGKISWLIPTFKIPSIYVC